LSRSQVLLGNAYSYGNLVKRDRVDLLERLDKGKGYELNVKPVNILSGTGRVEDDVGFLMRLVVI
jgi:hypothetical protein